MDEAGGGITGGTRRRRSANSGNRICPAMYSDVTNLVIISSNDPEEDGNAAVIAQVKPPIQKRLFHIVPSHIEDVNAL